jgi:hypothetical protein
MTTLRSYSGPLVPGTRIGAVASVMPTDGLADVEDAESEEPYNRECMQQVEGYINGLEHHIVDHL